MLKFNKGMQIRKVHFFKYYHTEIFSEINEKNKESEAITLKFTDNFKIYQFYFKIKISF